MLHETAIVAVVNGYSSQTKSTSVDWSGVILAVLSTGEADRILIATGVEALIKRKEFGNVLGIEICIWNGAKPLDFCTFMMPRSAITYLEHKYPL